MHLLSTRAANSCNKDHALCKWFSFVLVLWFSWDSVEDASLTAEEREQKSKDAVLRAKFMQQLVLSTIFGDS
jgi:hypothetical protein